MNNNGHSADIKVSIIVPVYNVAPYIKDCLESLINQTLQEIEIILINDASTDASGAICDTYAQKDSRIIVIHHEVNVRQGRSRNEGIAMAKGEYIGFVDPDDWVDLTFYEKLYSAAKKSGAQIVKGETIKVTNKGKCLHKSDLNKIINKGLKNKKPLFLLFDREHWSAIFRRKNIKDNNINYPPIRNSEDDFFLLKTCYYLTQLKIIKQARYYYRKHDASTFHKRDQEYYDSQLKCFELQLDFMNNHAISDYAYKEIVIKYVARLTRLYTSMDSNLISSDYKKHFFDCLIESLFRLKLDPAWYLESFILGHKDGDFLKMLPYGRLKMTIVRVLNLLRT